MPSPVSNLNWQQLLKSGNRIFIGSHAAVPTLLIDDLIANAKSLHDIEIVQLVTLSDNKWARPEFQHRFKVNTFFIGGNTVRQAVAANSSRPISMRRISLVPAPISYSLASRHKRPSGYSLM